jgi:hypothetical protein
MVGGINSHVYETLRTAIHIAAVFRHAVSRDPAMYQAFVESLRGAAVDVRSPEGFRVATPTLYPRRTDRVVGNP